MNYTFESCQLDIERRELKRDGELLNLRPKVFDVLALLIEQHERVVSKDELMNEVWPGRYISETTLSSSIKELRKALGDTGKEQQFIKTVHGKGFRFIADITEAQAPDAPDATDATITSDSEQIEQTAPELDSPPSPQTEALEQPATTLSMASERKNVSALRCALVDADALAEQIGHEAMHYLLQDLFTTAQEIITRFDGQITQWLSDGFLALFGVPAAHEDHARRALLAAAELIDHNRNQCEQQHQACISFGITSGDAIISGVPGNPQQYYTSLGSVMRFAETLCFNAGASRVAISTDSYHLLRADVRVSPLAQLAEAFLVEDIVAKRAGVPRRFRRHMATMVGRDHELNLLQQRLAQAEEYNGQAVAIMGSPGIGKSRLLSEFRYSLANRDIRFIQANCFAHLRNTSYYPLREYLRQCCDIDDADPCNIIEEKLSAKLATAEITSVDALPLLLKLLELAHDSKPLAQLSIQAQQDKTAAYLQQLLLDTGQPTVFVLEDMHWLDPSSQRWLDEFISQSANQPVLIITTYRAGTNPDWLQLPWTTQLALSPLNQEHCLRLLNSLPRAALLQDRLLLLVKLSGGNPFFLEELALSADHDDGENSIPDTVQGVLAARIDQLSQQDKQLLQAAAVIGQRGPVNLLAAITEFSEDELGQALLRLQCAELLFKDFSKSKHTFLFKNTLIQEAAYATQLHEYRIALHARTAKTLFDDFPELAERRPEFIAHHYSAAGDYGNALRYWQRAGRRAYERSAYIESTEYVNNGLALLEKIDNTQFQKTSELALLRTLGAAQMATCGYGAPEVERTWLRAQQLCEDLGDDSGLFRVLVGLSSFHTACGQFKQAFQCNCKLLRLARRFQNNGFILRAKAAMGELMLHCGRLRSAKRYLDQCLTLTAVDTKPVLSSHITAITATGYASLLYCHLQQDSEALNCAAQALQQAQSLQQPFALTVALCLNAEQCHFSNDPDNALIHAQQAITIAKEQKYPFWLGTALVISGWAKAKTGTIDEGVAAIHEGLGIICATGTKVQIPFWLGALADAYHMTGQTDAALSTVDEAITWANNTGENICLSRLEQLRNQLRLQINITEQGADDYRVNSMKIPAKYQEMKLCSA